jgi:hypothetical protein
MSLWANTIPLFNFYHYQTVFQKLASFYVTRAFAWLSPLAPLHGLDVSISHPRLYMTNVEYRAVSIRMIPSEM